MNSEQLHQLADAASIATFIIALIGSVVGVWGYVRFRCLFHRKTGKLEQYLREQKETKIDQGKRSVIRIIRDVGLTQDEIIQISFVSKKIHRWVTVDPASSIAKDLLFSYDDTKK